MKLLRKNLALIITTIATVILAIVGVLTYQTNEESLDLEKKRYEQGDIPPKRLIVYSLGPQVVGDLGLISDKIEFQLRVGGRLFNRLYRIDYSVGNPGKWPILPDDFIEPLRVTFPERWEVVFFNNRGYSKSNYKPHWKIADDHSIQLEDSLLNPSDIVDIEVYLTDTEKDDLSNADLKEIFKDQWSARITNLKEIEDQKGKLVGFLSEMFPERFSNKSKSDWDNEVVVTGPKWFAEFVDAGVFITPFQWGVYFVLVLAALVSFILTVLTLIVWNFSELGKIKISLIVSTISIVSFMAAESYYTFVAIAFKDIIWTNFVIVALHLIGTGYLIDAARKKRLTKNNDSSN